MNNKMQNIMSVHKKHVEIKEIVSNLLTVKSELLLAEQDAISI